MSANELKSEFLRTISERGFIHQCTGLQELDAKMAKEKITSYIGFDCTADSLHVGSLVSIMLLRWFQKFGHTPIVLMGGGTTKIGDPSGKDEARKFLSNEDIHNNMMGIRQVFTKYLDFNDGPDNAAFMVNNADWLDTLNYIGLLRDVGRHFSINRMLTFDSVKLRLEREQNLTFLEFNYMILQSYDFVELNKRFDCTLQMGGSDQWGNIVNGVDLGRKMGADQLFGLTTPLITTSSGAKMGKTANGAVWLNEDRLSAYDYWQFWRNTEDNDVGRFLKLFTELPMDEIARLEALQGAEINEAKKVLAFEATKLCHGEEAAQNAQKTAQNVFEKGGADEDLPTKDLDGFGASVLDILVDMALCKSKGEARRLVQQGGIKLNDQPLGDATKTIEEDDFDGSETIKISVGKKKHALLKRS